MSLFFGILIQMQIICSKDISFQLMLISVVQFIAEHLHFLCANCASGAQYSGRYVTIFFYIQVTLSIWYLQSIKFLLL